MLIKELKKGEFIPTILTNLNEHILRR